MVGVLGEPRLVRARGEPARDAAGAVVGLVGSMVPVDTQRRADVERERLQTLLRQSEARWRFALEGGGYGVWDYDLRTGSLYQTVPIETLLGYEAGDFRNKIEDVRQRTLPEDLLRSDRELRAHLRGLTPVFVNERRVRCRDGRYRWLQFRGRLVERDDSGRPVRMVGTFLDVDARKRGEQSQRERERRFRAIFHSTFQLMALIRPDGILLEVNAPAQRELGFDAVQSIGRPVIEVLGSAGFAAAETLETLDAALRQAAAGVFVRRSVECRCRSGLLALDCSLKPILDEQGRVSLIVAEARDITALRSAELALRARADRHRLRRSRRPRGCSQRDILRDRRLSPRGTGGGRFVPDLAAGRGNRRATGRAARPDRQSRGRPRP
jgi:PAS domain S-box-containing protein